MMYTISRERTVRIFFCISIRIKSYGKKHFVLRPIMLYHFKHMKGRKDTVMVMDMGVILLDPYDVIFSIDVYIKILNVIF